jgi:hypothetical protein
MRFRKKIKSVEFVFRSDNRNSGSSSRMFRSNEVYKLNLDSFQKSLKNLTRLKCCFLTPILFEHNEWWFFLFIKKNSLFSFLIWKTMDKVCHDFFFLQHPQ